MARSSIITAYGQTKLKYKKNIEIVLIITLVLLIVGFRLAANINFEKYLLNIEEMQIELVELLEIPPPIEPPPKLKMEEIIEIPPEPEKTDEGNDLTEEIEEMLGENEEKEELALDSGDMGAYLTSSSSLDDLGNSELRIRNRMRANDNGISLQKGKFYDDLNDNGNLDIGGNSRSHRKQVSDKVSIDLKIKSEAPTVNNNETRYRRNDPKLGLSGLPEKILTFGTSTMGTEDYKLWNKINSELDRLNKGRYGSVPKEIKRSRSGFHITFRFTDGSNQEIHWRNDGNVWIKVIGNGNKTSVQELRRALHSLLELTLSY